MVIRIGSQINDTLLGTVGNDTLSGLQGADVLSGGGGVDTLLGGSGADTLQIFGSNDLGDGGVFNGGRGTDTLHIIKDDTGFSGVDLQDSTIKGIERIVLQSINGRDVNLRLNASDFGRGIAKDATVQFLLDEADSGSFTVLMGDVTALDLSKMRFTGDEASAFFDNSFFASVSLENSKILGSEISESLQVRADHFTFRGNGGDDSISLYGSARADLRLGQGDDKVTNVGERAEIFGGDGDDYVRYSNGDMPDAQTVLNGGAGHDTLGFEPRDGSTADLTQGQISGFESLLISTVHLPGDAVVTVKTTARMLTDGFSADLSYNAFYRENHLRIAMEDVKRLDMSAYDISAEDLTVTTTGGRGVQKIVGADRSDVMLGKSGADVLRGGAGDDQLIGGKGRDVLVGEAGADRLSGGNGVDVFVFRGTSDSPTGTGQRDTILDLTAADTLRFVGFDGDTTSDGLQTLGFVGATPFSGRAGELRTTLNHDGQSTRLLADTNGDGSADFELLLAGVTTLSATIDIVN